MKVLYSPLQFCSCHENVSFICLTLHVHIGPKDRHKAFFVEIHILNLCNTMIIRQVSCHPHCSLIPTVKQNSTIKFSFSGYMLHFFLKKTILQSLPNQKAWINAETRDTPRIKMTAFHGSIQPRHSVTESWHHERQSRDIRSDLTSTPTPEICGR